MFRFLYLFTRNKIIEFLNMIHMLWSCKHDMNLGKLISVWLLTFIPVGVTMYINNVITPHSAQSNIGHFMVGILAYAGALIIIWGFMSISYAITGFMIDNVIKAKNNIEVKPFWKTTDD